MTAFKVSPLAGALGAEVFGADLRTLPDAGWQASCDDIIRVGCCGARARC